MYMYINRLLCSFGVILFLDFLNLGNGCLTQLFTAANPLKHRGAFDDYGFSKEHVKSRMKFYPLNRLNELSMFAKTKVGVY